MSGVGEKGPSPSHDFVAGPSLSRGEREDAAAFLSLGERDAEAWRGG